MKLSLLTISIFFFQILHGQNCDSLKSEGVTYSFPISHLEALVKSGCDKAKLSLAYELLTGYRTDKDSTRAIELLEECKNRDIDCNYELFKISYDSNPEKAYKLITEIALIDTLTCYWDSAMVVNARLIAADMSERKLGNQDDLTMSGAWYLLYYEIEKGWRESPTKNMTEEMKRVLKELNAEELDEAYEIARSILGHNPVFKKEQIK